MCGKEVFLVATVILFSMAFSQLVIAEEQKCNDLVATHVGTENKDTIRGTSGDDVIVGLGGDDRIYGRGGNDVICGGPGNDTIYGNSGNDILIGGEGRDHLDGSSGNDTCDSDGIDKKVRDCEISLNEKNDEEFEHQFFSLKEKIDELFNRLIFWNDIQEIPDDIADGDDDKLSQLACNVNQIPVFNGEEWVCDEKTVPVEHTLSDLDCNTDEIAKWKGDSWECSLDVAFSSFPIFFHHVRLGGGETVLAGTYGDTKEFDQNNIEILMPTSGEIRNLIAKTTDSPSQDSPRTGEYVITVIKNEGETLLTCTIGEITNVCSNDQVKIPLTPEDTVLIKVEATMNAPLGIIRISAFFDGI